MSFTDRKLKCRDCPDEFTFTAGEQEFYASKGLEHDPVRCPNCRQQKKTSSGMESTDIPRYGVYASYGGRTPRQLFVAECGQCKKLTEVPFRPRDDRPDFAPIVTESSGNVTRCWQPPRKKQLQHA